MPCSRRHTPLRLYHQRRKPARPVFHFRKKNVFPRPWFTKCFISCYSFIVLLMTLLTLFKIVRMLFHIGFIAGCLMIFIIYYITYVSLFPRRLLFTHVWDVGHSGFFLTYASNISKYLIVSLPAHRASDPNQISLRRI